MSFAHRSVLKEMREKKAKAAKAVRASRFKVATLGGERQLRTRAVARG